MSRAVWVIEAFVLGRGWEYSEAYAFRADADDCAAMYAKARVVKYIPVPTKKRQKKVKSR